MASLRRQILFKAFKLLDLLVMVFSFALATWAIFYQFGTVSFDEFLSMRIKVQNFAFFLGFLWVWHLIFSSFGLYHSKRLSNRWPEIFDVIKATSLGALVIFIASISFSIEMATPVFLLVFWVGSGAIAITSRLTLRYALEQIRIRGRNLRYMLLVGTNQRAINFAQEIESKKELGYHIIGFVDDEWSGIGEIQRNGYELVANFNDFPSFLRDNVVDEAVISLPVNSHYKQASRIVALCEEQGIIVRYLSDIFNSKLAHSKTGHFEGEPLVTLHTGGMEGWQVLAKRMLDIVLSSVLLLLLSPLFLVAAFLIMITSPGPVFFIQERLGFNKRQFRMIKFRSMVKDAEKMIDEVAHLNQEKGPAFKIKNDPRITWFGNLLRKTSIDELPQLINVLKGEMSLVGPRPLFYWEVERINDPWIRRRFSVKPGLTGLWQVSGRSNVTFDKRIQMDLKYIDNWSLPMDLYLLIRTIPVVVFGKGSE